MRRAALVLPTTLVVVTLSFALIHLAPGDPVLALAGDGGDAAYYAATRQRFGLDRPLPVQFGAYLGRLAHGDLGYSYIQGRPVRTVIWERVPATLLLTGSALIVSTVIGVLLAVFVAPRRGKPIDIAVTTASVALFATPAFWLGQLAILWLALRTGWFPVQGMTDARTVRTGAAAFFDVAHHLVLPVAVLAAQEVAAVTRLLRSGLIDELETAHVLMARSKGLRERQVLWRHALRRPFIPVAAVIGSRLGQLLAGSVVVEIVFGWPGVGRLLLSAMQSRDIPLVLGVFVLTSLTVIAGNLIVDILTARLDPLIGRTGVGS